MSFLELYETWNREILEVSLKKREVSLEKLVSKLESIRLTCAESVPQPWKPGYMGYLVDLLGTIEAKCDLPRQLWGADISTSIVETFVYIVRLFDDTRMAARIALSRMSHDMHHKNPKLLAAAPEFIKRMGIAEADVKEDARELALPGRERSRDHWAYVPRPRHSRFIRDGRIISDILRDDDQEVFP